MAQKLELEKEKKAKIELAGEKDVALKKKISTIGNIVHESVPVHNNEVGAFKYLVVVQCI